MSDTPLQKINRRKLAAEMLTLAAAMSASTPVPRGSVKPRESRSPTKAERKRKSRRKMEKATKRAQRRRR